MGSNTGTFHDAWKRGVFQAAGRESGYRGVARHRLRIIRRGLCSHRARRKRAAYPPGCAQCPALSRERARATAQRRSARDAALRTGAHVMAPPLKVGVAGLGTVGAALLAQIAHQRDALIARCGRPIDVVAVCARSRNKDRGVDLKKMKWFSEPSSLAGEPAKSAVEAALVAGKSVVTANKALLSRHGVKLAGLAERNHIALNFEAAVGGAIPIVKTLREGMAGNSFERIYGILNGTCNYILTRMEQDRMSFADCLKDAQRLGYAEADPSFDIEGHDTAQKLAILASLAFGTKADQSAIYVEGISSITPADLLAADELGYRVKLLGVAVRTPKGIEQRVHPTMVRKDSAIAQVMGVTNAVTVDAADISPLTLVGPGAGGAATASAVLSDIGDIARGVRTAPFGRPTARLTTIRKAPMQRHEGGY